MLQFNYTSNGYEVTGQVAPLEADIVIPSTFDDGVNGGFPVTSIGMYAFDRNQLTSVTIPDSVVSIEYGAFQGNQLTSVIIPDSVTSIGGRAFANNQLTSLTIPNSVTSIGTAAFVYNPIENISVSSANVNFKSDDNVLFSKDGKTLILSAQKNSYTIPTGVTSVGDWAFSNNQLTSVTIPDSVTSIGNFAFAYNELTSVTIPNSVESIGEYAFADNQLTSITIPDSVTSIGSDAFTSNQLTSVTIPDSVTSIGALAFRYNKLTSVVWEISVAIPARAFDGEDNKITSFTITSDTLIPLTDIDAFGGVTVENPMTVHVQRQQLIEDYKAATNWSFLYNNGIVTFEPPPPKSRKLGTLYANLESTDFSTLKAVKKETVEALVESDSLELNTLYVDNYESGGTGEDGLIEYTVEGIENGWSPGYPYQYFREPSSVIVRHKSSLPKLTKDEIEFLTGANPITFDVPNKYNLEDYVNYVGAEFWGQQYTDLPGDNYYPLHFIITRIRLNEGIIVGVSKGYHLNNVVYGETYSNKSLVYEWIDDVLYLTGASGQSASESYNITTSNMRSDISKMSNTIVEKAIPLGYKITGFVQKQPTWTGRNYQVGDVVTISADGFGPINLNVDEVDGEGKFTKLSILTPELSDFIFEDYPTFTPPEGLPNYGAPVSGGSGTGGRVSPVLEVVPSSEGEDITISEVTSSGNKLITSSLVDGKISKAMGTPSRIENTGNTQFVDTNSDNISIDLMPSLSQGGGSETGRLKLARNMFELSAEMIYANPNLKYKYSFKSKDDGSIEIKVEDTDELSGKGTETYSFDFTSQDNPNQVTRKFEVDLAIQQAIEDVLLGEV